MESDTFLCRMVMVKLVWILSGVFIEKNYQTISIFYHKISIKSISFHTIYITFMYYGDSIIFLMNLR